MLFDQCTMPRMQCLQFGIDRNAPAAAFIELQLSLDGLRTRLRQHRGKPVHGRCGGSQADIEAGLQRRGIDPHVDARGIEGNAQGLDQCIGRGIRIAGMVAQLRRQEAVAFGSHVLVAMQAQPQRRVDAVDRGAPVVQQLAIVDQRARHALGAVQCIDQIAPPQQVADRGRQSVARLQRCRDFARRARHQHHPRIDAMRGHCPTPQRHEPAQARILDRPQRLFGEFARDQFADRSQGFVGGLGCLPTLRQQPRIVPGHAQRGQQTLMDRHRRTVLPEPGRVVASGRHQLVAQRGTVQIEQAGQRRGAAAMHPEHEHARAARTRSGCSGDPGHVLAPTHGRRPVPIMRSACRLRSVHGCAGTAGTACTGGCPVCGSSSNSKRWLSERVSSSAWVSVSMM